MNSFRLTAIKKLEINYFQFQKKFPKNSDEIPPRFELGLLDSKSKVLTVTPWDLFADILEGFLKYLINYNQSKK